ncbi:MAG: hypothetical protein ACI8XB_001496 [Patiriisocius sp.]|jgi:hypothetical protein
MPILWNLKSDPAEYVRLSVANNLNDIAKDNPHIVIDIFQQRKDTSKETVALIKYGARTPLKAGNKEILEIFGYNPKDVDLKDLMVQTKTVHLGGDLTFSAVLTNQSRTEKIVRLEYAIYFMRKRG